MKRNEPIRHIMTEDVLTVHQGQKPSEVHTILNENSVHHVPVVSGERLVGLITATDLYKLSFEAYGTGDSASFDNFLDHTLTIDQMMHKDVATIGPNDSVRTAAQILNTGDFHCLPVVDEDMKLLGLVTTTDLINYFLEQY